MLRKLLAVLAYGASFGFGIVFGLWLIAKPGFLDATAPLNPGPPDWGQAFWGAVLCVLGVIVFFFFIGMAVEFHDMVLNNRRLPWKKGLRELQHKYRWLHKSQ